MEWAQNGMWPIWNVNKMKCEQNEMCSKKNVTTFGQMCDFQKGLLKLILYLTSLKFQYHPQT